ncbi:hypothetical protein LZ30DRAFT_254656 [Colletotrichum cereale]|nr:hypothetical protein LZ30DRAFT_254656 [Colletotrichum cereale]
MLCYAQLQTTQPLARVGVMRFLRQASISWATRLQSGATTAYLGGRRLFLLSEFSLFRLAFDSFYDYWNTAGGVYGVDGESGRGRHALSSLLLLDSSLWRIRVCNGDIFMEKHENALLEPHEGLFFGSNWGKGGSEVHITRVLTAQYSRRKGKAKLRAATNVLDE